MVGMELNLATLDKAAFTGPALTAHYVVRMAIPVNRAKYAAGIVVALRIRARMVNAPAQKNNLVAANVALEEPNAFMEELLLRIKMSKKIMVFAVRSPR
jgi:hypothetical protein